MKNIKYLLILLLFLPFSCIENESRYGGTAIDEIKIEGIEKHREIELGSKLEVKPVITTKFGDKSDLTYIWYKYNQEQSVEDTLSHEKNLSVIINDVIPGVSTTLVLKVTDNRTGIFALNRSTFVTLGKYSGGTLILCLVNGEKELYMLKKDGTTLYENIYASANEGGKLGNDSKEIILTNSHVRNPLGHKSVIVTCKDANGGVYLDPSTMVKKNTMREKFAMSEDLPATLDITGYTVSSESDFLFVDGLVYNRPNGESEKVDWNPALVVLSAPTDYSVARYTAHPTSYPFYGIPIFFDNLNGRFMFNNRSGYFSFFSGSGHDFSKFDPNALGKGVQMIASGSMNSSLDEVWALMKNEKGYFIITYKFVYEGYTYSFVSLSRTELSQAQYPGLYQGSCFIPGTKPKVDNYIPWDIEAKGASDLFFYLSSDDVYVFNVKNLSEGVLLHGATENYTFTGLDCTEVPAPTEENPNATYVQLTVAVKDRQLTSKSGGIATYRLNHIGGISAQRIYAKTGFCDEVLYTVEKLD